MNLLKKITITLSFCLFTMISFGFGLDALDISPDGKYTAVAGSNYGFYVLDNSSQSLIKRIRIEESAVENIWFSKDGKSLWISGSQKLTRFNVSDWSKIKEYDSESKCEISQDHSLIMTLSSYKKKFQKIDANTGEVKGMFIHTIEDDIDDFAIDLKNNEIFLLHRRADDDTEEKKSLSYSDTKDMTVIQRVEAENKADGKKYPFTKLKLTDGTISSEGSTWFSESYSPDLLSINGETYLLSSSGCVKISAKNETVTLDIKDRSYDDFSYNKADNSIVGSHSDSYIKYDINSGTSKVSPFDGKFGVSSENNKQIKEVFVISFGNYTIKYINANGTTKTVTIL